MSFSKLLKGDGKLWSFISKSVSMCVDHNSSS